MKNDSIKMIVVLTVTGVVAGAFLAGFFHIVHPRIIANAMEEEKKAVFAVLEGIKSYDTLERQIPSASGGAKGMETVRIFKGLDEQGNIVGYAFVAKGPGFAGTIKMMVGLKIDLKTLAAMKVLDQLETPGLGNKITEPKFEGQFKGLSIEPKIEYIKNKKPEKPNQIQAITGATISSRAVVNGLNNRIEIILNLLANEGVGDGRQQ